jgi:hypothetical protein
VEGEVTISNADSKATACKGHWIFPGMRKAHQKMEAGTVVLSLRFFANWPDGLPLFNHNNIIVVAAASDRKLTSAARGLESLAACLTFPMG